MSPEEVQAYEDSLKIYRDLKNSLDFAKEECRNEGGNEEMRLVVKNSLKSGLEKEIIARITSLSPGEIERIKKEEGLI